MTVIFDPILGQFKQSACCESGVMTKAEYDTNDDGIVDGADKLVSADASKKAYVDNSGNVITDNN
jgi:hypothetical protein